MANESSSPQNSQNPESLPDYKRVLSFWDLFFISTGLIVGSGVMIFTGEAIGITGRSVPDVPYRWPTSALPFGLFSWASPRFC